MRVPPSIVLTMLLSLMIDASMARAIESPREPFERTENRERCDHYDPNRLPFFGTTHLHTGLSFDASIRFVDYASGNDPRGAYR